MIGLQVWRPFVPIHLLCCFATTSRGISQSEIGSQLAYCNSNSAALRRTAAVVRNRRDVADQHDVQSGGGQRAYCGLASGARTLHTDFDALHAVLVARDARGSQRSLLRGVRRALARALETDSSR